MKSLLKQLDDRKTPLNIVIIGVGAMGKGLYYQCHITPGVRCLAIADLDVNRCIDAADMMDDPYAVVSTEGELQTAIDQNKTAVTDDGMLLAACESADVVIEATSAIAAGARFVITALENRKHVVLMNAEIDLLYGPYFAKVAAQNGVVCTSIDGDQYGVLKRLIDDFELWGFQLVMAGNIKGFLDRYADPISIIPEADKRNLDYKMCTSYTDGTKLNIEMAIIANAFGMKTVVPGMLGPRAAHVSEVFDIYDFEALWADRVPFVDYVLEAEPGGGVFAIGYHDHPYQRRMMDYYKMGKGPFYLFYRHCHLCHVEAMPSILEAALADAPLLQPWQGLKTNVYAYAKKDLKAGELLDGLGGHTCYGMIENCTPHNGTGRLPILLAENVRVTRDIPKDHMINFSDILYNTDDSAFDLYAKTLDVSNAIQQRPPLVDLASGS